MINYIHLHLYIYLLETHNNNYSLHNEIIFPGTADTYSIMTIIVNIRYIFSNRCDIYEIQNSYTKLR